MNKNIVMSAIVVVSVSALALSVAALLWSARATKIPESPHGMDITAAPSQAENLVNLFSSDGTLLAAFSSVGGFAQNISSPTAMVLSDGSNNPVFVVDTVTERVTTAGIRVNGGMELKDEETGAFYCIRLKSGELVSTPGECS